jgi:hypothetical protein
MLVHAIIVSVNTVGILQSRKVLKDLYKRFVETDRVFNTLSQFPQAFLIQTFQNFEFIYAKFLQWIRVFFRDFLGPLNGPKNSILNWVLKLNLLIKVSVQ